MVVDDEEHQFLVHQNIESRRRDNGPDKNWRSNLEIGGGFGWGMKFSRFWASKNDGEVEGSGVYPTWAQVTSNKC
jgi:hypothetical protein